MIARHIQYVLRWLKRVIRQPRDELDRWQRVVRFAYDLGRFGARQLHHDRAPQMAAALAFRTLFGLLPVLIVATVLVRAVIGLDVFVTVIADLLESVRLHEATVQLPEESGGGTQTLAAWLADLINEAATVNVGTIGWVGVVLVIYAAISLMATIENSFNIIYRISRWSPVDATCSAVLVSADR